MLYGFSGKYTTDKVTFYNPICLFTDYYVSLHKPSNQLVMTAFALSRYSQVVSKKLINIPNTLSFYRLLTFPVILYLAIAGYEQAFAVLIIINLLSDVLDGLLARALKQETEFGARLDSIADISTYFLVFLGILVFKRHDFAPHVFSFSVFIGLLVVAILLSLIKFRRFPSLHLYSWKIGGYIQGFFFFILFAFGFYTPLYYFMIVWGILAFIEHIIIQLMIPNMISNAKGLYWVIRDRKNVRS